MHLLEENSSMKTLWSHRCVYMLSWQRFEDGVQHIFQSLGLAGYRPDVLICIVRGGLVVGTKLAHLLDVSDLVTVHIQRNTTSDMYPDRHPPQVMTTSLPIPEQARILIVDDIIGSGATMQTATTLAKTYHPISLQTVSLVVNTNGLNHAGIDPPDYFAFQVDDWLVFPWENVSHFQEAASLQHLPLKEV
jgi:uncharacterized protein